MDTTATNRPDPARRRRFDERGRARGTVLGRNGGDFAATGRLALPLRALVAASSALLALSAHAQFEPEVTLGITHTDNVALEAENEQSEIIYRVEPSFHYAKETRAVTIAADYLLQAFHYRDLDDNEVFHQWRANVRAALVPDTFFLDVGGSREQTIIDPEQTIPFSNLSISGNRQNLDEWYVAPSFQYALGGDVAATGEYRHSWLEYEEDQSQSGRYGSAMFSLDNYRRERGLSWALRYEWDRVEYDFDEPWEYQKAMAELGFWVGTDTRLFAAAGQESAWDAPLDPKLQDDLWEAGVAQEIGERLSAEFAVGERSFGNSWRGDFEFRFRRGSMSLSYSETPTTEGGIRVRRTAFDGPEVPPNLLVRPDSSERFILERLAWTLNIELRRTILSLSLFDSDRVQRIEADGSPLPDEAERGASGSLSWEVGARTSLRLGAWWTDRELDTGESLLANGYFEIGYQLGQRTDLVLNYTYAEEDPEGLAEVRDYVVNMVSLDLTRTF